MRYTQAHGKVDHQAAGIDVLIVEADRSRRRRLRDALEASGLRVAVVEQLAEIERWPSGGIVVTDYERFTPWWTEVGATKVVVLADTPEQGIEARQRGAATWISRESSPDALAVLIGHLGIGTPAKPAVRRCSRESETSVLVERQDEDGDFDGFNDS